MKDFYIRRCKGSTKDSWVSTTQWDIVCCEVPFKLYGEVKDLPKNNWEDEDGNDVYIPSLLRMNAYDMDITFAYKGDSPKAKIKAFIDHLCGVGGIKSADLEIYDPYTGIGRQHVTLKSVNNDLYVKQSVNENGQNTTQQVVQFTLTFTINDPVTNISK